MTPEQRAAQIAKQIDGGKSMAEMWEGFAGMTLQGVPPGGPQWRDMQGAFFAGGLSLFNWFMVQLEEGTEPTQGDLDRVSLMDAELRGFFTREKPQ